MCQGIVSQDWNNLPKTAQDSRLFLSDPKISTLKLFSTPTFFFFLWLESQRKPRCWRVLGGGTLFLILSRGESIPKSKFCSISLLQASLSFALFLYQRFKPPGVAVLQISKEILSCLAIPQRLECFIYSWSVSYKCCLLLFCQGCIRGRKQISCKSYAWIGTGQEDARETRGFSSPFLSESGEMPLCFILQSWCTKHILEDGE